MAYFVALLSAWLLVSASTALRPGRRGVFAVLAFPVGWAAGELPVQAIVVQGGLLGLLWWWGWPRTHWLGIIVVGLAIVVAAQNVALIAMSLRSRLVVSRALATSPRRPLALDSLGDDRFGAWWRTALQIPLHPRRMELIRDLSYGPDARQRLDVWRTLPTPVHAPVILYVHGGGWTMGDKREQGRPMLHEFVARGWVVATTNYRLAPKDPWPAQIEDVVRCLAWVKRSIADYGGDPERIVISGGSAGGHLAALAALAADDLAWRPSGAEDVTDWSVRGCVPFYGVLETLGDESHWHGLGRGLRTLLESRVVRLPYAGHEDLYRSLSPYHRIDEDAPPFLVVQGTTDTLVDVNVARDFVARFRDVALAPAYYVELPFAQHAFDLTASPRTSATTRAAVAFATSVTAPRPEMTSAHVASYQAPPTELYVENRAGALAPALGLVAELGPYRVVTSDNPGSRRQDEATNSCRRDELKALLASRGVECRRSVARDPTGRWPDEEGIALIGRPVEFARALARAFDQFAFYEVTAGGVNVLDAERGDVLL